jgi:FtsX-like permease family protein
MSKVVSIAAGLLLAISACAPSALAQSQPPAVDAGFLADVKALTAGPHRLAGFEDGSLAASRHVEKRLREMGITDVFVQDFPVTQPLTTECRLFIDGEEITGESPVLYPVRPNVLQASVTPTDGIVGETLYAGRGETHEYQARQAKDKIVVLEFDCDTKWLNAFAFGARAVVFIGGDQPAAHAYQHTNVPANLPRFYVSSDVADRLELRKRPRQMKILAACEWRELRGRNVIAVLRGTSPRFDETRPPQALVLAAPLDSLSEVPALSPGARDAGNVASLLWIAEQFVQNRPARDTILCFLDGQSLNHMGARAFYGAIFRKEGKATTTLEQRLNMFKEERGFYATVHALISRDPGKIYDKPADIRQYKEEELAEAEQQFASSDDELEDKEAKLAAAAKLRGSVVTLRKQLRRVNLAVPALAKAVQRFDQRHKTDRDLKNTIGRLTTEIDNTYRYFNASVRMLRDEARAGSAKLLERLRPLRLKKADLESPELMRDLRKLQKDLAELEQEAQDADQSKREELEREISRIREAPEVQRIEARLRQLDPTIQRLRIEERGWNTLQRILHNKDTAPDYDELFGYIKDEDERRALKQSTPKLFEKLLARCKQVCMLRIAELDVAIREAEQARALRDAVGPEENVIVLHVGINLGDSRSQWSFVHGDDSDQIREDKPGKYTQVFKTMLKVHEALAAAGQGGTFHAEAVSESYPNRLFSPALFVDSGAIARIFAVHNVSAMTVMDPMPRQGQPADTFANLDIPTLFQQSAQLPGFLKGLSDHTDLNIPRSIRPIANHADAEWAGTKSVGPVVRQTGAGSAMRARPVRGATVAVVRPIATGPWNGGIIEKVPPGFSYPLILTTNGNGNFELPVHSQDSYLNCLLFAATFDAPQDDPDEIATSGRGLITSVTSSTKLRAQQNITKSGVDVLRIRCKTAVGYGYSRGALGTQAMRDISTANFPANQHLLCELQNVVSVYAPYDAKGFKFFNRLGMVLLNNNKEKYKGLGFSLRDEFSHPIVLDATSHDLLNLNGARLELLRNNRINQDSLEILHGQAKDLREEKAGEEGQATASATRSLDEILGDSGASSSISRRVYRPLVGVMNDLVTAVVLLLLLAIPFAFAIERLVIGTPHIYRQIGWFAFFFLITFALLFLVNPAFKIASTPVIIFLAFAIILLSSLVIFIMVRKLQTEIRKMQGLATTVHSADVSRLSTMMAAVSMGISTMRRRPLRTFLTAATVVLLTFTILTFASFGSSWGTRRTYEGPMTDIPPRIVLRHQLWGEITEGDFDTLRGRFSREATVVPRYWVSPTAQEAKDAATQGTELEMLITDQAVGRITKVAAAIGLDPRDVKRQPELGRLLEGRLDLLEQDGIFLTEAVRDDLGLTNDDIGKARLCFHDQTLTFAGTVSDALATHTMVEGSEVLPVDYQSSAGGAAENIEVQSDTESLSETPGMESAQFLRYNLHQVVVVSPGAALRMGGRVRSVCVYPNSPEEIQSIAERAATVSMLPTYVGDQGGVYRLIFTSLARASGVKDLLVPVLLGGMIIFATMLGSVSDREKEIYTFSSLGLAPAHVASLFFAEAAMYAVVGGMGGYLLGQMVARLLSWSSQFLHISVPVMNYSSTNAIVTILIVMTTVLISTIYPAVKASRSANPGIQRSWRIPKPEGNLYDLLFPFTVSGYDIIGVVSFLKEHFDNYSDASLGVFATNQCGIFRQHDSDMLGFKATVALAPFDLGVTQNFALLSRPSEIEGIDEIRILIYRVSGANGDWRRSNRVFINDLRRQLLIWRALPDDVMNRYRQKTLEQWDSLPVEQVDENSIGEQA